MAEAWRRAEACPNRTESSLPNATIHFVISTAIDTANRRFCCYCRPLESAARKGAIPGHPRAAWPTHTCMASTQGLGSSANRLVQ